LKEQKPKAKAKTKSKVKAKAKAKIKTKTKANQLKNTDEVVSIDANTDQILSAGINADMETDMRTGTISEVIRIDELVNIEEPVASEEPINNETSTNIFYSAIDRIQDISILRDIKSFYESEYSNLLTDFRYTNKRVLKLFETSLITVAIFSIYIIYLFTQKYFAALSYAQIVFVLPLEIGIVLLLMSVYQNFKLQNFQTYFRKIETNYPVQKAYEKIKIEAKREKEFLVRMIYNYSVIVKENTQMLNEQTHILNWQYNYFLATITVTFLSLVLIVLT